MNPGGPLSLLRCPRCGGSGFSEIDRHEVIVTCINCGRLLAMFAIEGPPGPARRIAGYRPRGPYDQVERAVLPIPEVANSGSDGTA